MSCINQKIESAMKDKNIIKIMNKASSSFSNKLDKDIIYTCQLNALWKSFVNFREDKNTKFTTYLFKGVIIECLKEIKFQNKNKCNKILHNNIMDNKNNSCILIDILDEVQSDYEKELIIDKFSNLTILEMANKRNSNRETVRKQLKNTFHKISKRY